MSRHPSDQAVEAYRRGGLDPAEAARTREHLGECRPCRDRLAAQDRFDLLLSRGLPRAGAPARLRDRVTSVLAAEAAAGRARRRRLWTRASLGAAALAAVALGLAALMQVGAHAVDAGARDTSLAASRLVRGQLVCIGCARHGVPAVQHADCSRHGDPEHATGLRTPDGNLWRLTGAPRDEPLLADRRMRGTWVEVDARPYPGIGYLGVRAIRRL